MSVKQVSIGTTESNIKKYVCSPTDSIFTYPSDCDDGSTMYIQGEDELNIAKLEKIDGEWKYVESLYDLPNKFGYSVVEFVDDVATIDMGYAFEKYATAVTVPTYVQVESVEVEGTITVAGDGKCTISSDEFEADIVVAVPVLLDDDATAIALALKTALQATEAVTDLFDVVLNGTTVSLAGKVVGVNDNTLNIALADDTCTGITAVTTSTTTVSGLGTSDKEFVFANFNRDCELGLFLHINGGCEISFPEGTVFNTEISFEAGKKYLLNFVTFDGGTNVYGSVVGVY